MKFRLFFWIVFSLLSSWSAKGQDSAESYGYLKKGFQAPPMSALPKVYWWWLNGDVNPIRLKKELVDMKQAGIAGVDIFDIGGPEIPNPDNMIPAGPAFMGKESLNYIKTAVDEAGKLGMSVDLSVSSSWNAGGSWVKPENAAKTLYYSEKEFNGPLILNTQLPFPALNLKKDARHVEISLDKNGKPAFYKEVAVLAIPITNQKIDTTQIINISEYFNNNSEVLHWSLPKGQWKIVRYICANSGKSLNSPSPNSNGLEINPLDSAATYSHFQYFINKLKPALGGDFNNSALRALYLASYENNDLLWTKDLPAEFKSQNNYDILKFVPAIFNPEIFDEKLINNFQFDFRKTISELMIKNFYKTAKNICNKNGLLLISESGGPGGWHNIPVEALKSFSAVDIPRGEFWNRYENHNIGDYIDTKWLVKEIAAASHIYKRGIVEEESFTSWQNWQEGPADLKTLADRAFCEGMNRLVIHGFSHEPSFKRLPGIGFYAGTHFNDRNTWWPKIRPFNEYLGRVSFILQHSRFISDVLYYNGDDVPGLVPPKNTHFKAGDGYDYEVINTDILLHQLTVKDGQLNLPGVSKYKLLYIGDKTAINPLVLKKLTQLASEGALIIGAKPNHAEGLSNRRENDSLVRALADSFWISAVANEINASSFKKGVIYSNVLPLQALKEKEIVPDFFYADPQSSALDYIHFANDSLDFYFVRNTTDRWVSRNCSFRQQNKVPEIWEPVSGKIHQVTIFKQVNKQEEIPLTWAPNASFFVVFRKESGNNLPHYNNILDEDMHSPRLEYTDNGFYLLDKGNYDLFSNKSSQELENRPEFMKLQGDWKLTFPKNWGAPATAVFPRLISWSESKDKGIRYFSGTAIYEKKFMFNGEVKGGKIYLNLGNLAEVGDVWLNGQHLGITWTKPYKFNVTNIIKDGENILKVEISDTWSNRLIGDARENEHFAQTNISKGNPNLLLHQYLKPNNIEVPWKEIPLRRSGLFGPVTIESMKLNQ